MNLIDTEKVLREVPGYASTVHTTKHAMHDEIVRRSGLQTLADFFHGIWLGHPLHPLLTDVTIGAWLSGTLLDLVSLRRCPPKGIEQAADGLTEIGIASAIPTALAGLTDFTAVSDRGMTTAATHGLMNTLILALYSVSAVQRRRGNRGSGLFLSSLAFGMLMVSAWLGGELAYKYKIGVNKAATDIEEPEGWLQAFAEQDLQDGQHKQVDIKGQKIVLYRNGNDIYAIGAICSHEGCDLEKYGDFKDQQVMCTCHNSVFDLRDGSVIHGPAVYPEPAFETRIQNGQIEIRLKKRTVEEFIDEMPRSL